MDRKEKAKQKLLDIVDQKRKGTIIFCDKDELGYIGDAGIGSAYTFASMVGFQLMKEIRDLNKDYKDIAVKLARKFTESNITSDDYPLDSKSDLSDSELLKELITEITSGSEASVIKVCKGSELELVLQNLVEIQDFKDKIADNWKKENNDSINVWEFYRKHRRIYHNTPYGAIFPCGKVYSADGDEDASEHTENCELCSALLRNFEETEKIIAEGGK